jgi:hypothetical protein
MQALGKFQGVGAVAVNAHGIGPDGDIGALLAAHFAFLYHA